MYRFIWIGGFPYGLFSKDFRHITKAIEHRPTNTFFPGFVEDIFEVYSGADVFLMPSYAEGHSIVMLEALSMKLPMIAHNTEEYQEAFSDMIYYYNDVNNITVDVFDKKHLLTYKKKTKQINTYDIKAIAKQHVKLYDDMSASCVDSYETDGIGARPRRKFVPGRVPQNA